MSLSFLLEPRALLSMIFCCLGLACILRRSDPVELICRWLYALRRGVWIAGTMIWDAPAEARYRWQTQRPSDIAAIQRLEIEYPAGPERT